MSFIHALIRVLLHPFIRPVVFKNITRSHKLIGNLMLQARPLRRLVRKRLVSWILMSERQIGILLRLLRVYTASQ